MHESHKEKFLELVQTDHWATLDDLVKRTNDGDFWTDDMLDGAVESFKRSYVRRMVKQIRDEDGWPVIASIEVTDEEGNRQRVYMPETLFDVEKYRQIVGYWSDRAHYAIQMSNGYTKRSNRRYHEQLPLPFAESAAA